MKLINKAWKLQYRIEKYILELPSLSLKTYLLIITILLFSTGFILFFAVLLLGYGFLFLNPLTDPLFFLGYGFTTFIAYLGVKLWH